MGREFMSLSIYRRGEPLLPTALQFKFNTRIYMVKEMEIEQFKRTNYSRVNVTSKCFTCPYLRGEIRRYPINTFAEAMFFLLQINLR
jgi:uncharacterized protein YwqG